MNKTVIKIQKQLIEKIREKYPEFRDLSDASVVRIALRKLLGDDTPHG